jgi:hypothetical protein
VAAAHGGEVPGQAKYPGDDPRDDSYPAWLHPGEKVIPASVADDPEATMAFLKELKKHHEKVQKRAA